jgi:hypothetical protein
MIYVYGRIYGLPNGSKVECVSEQSAEETIGPMKEEATG